MEMQQEAAEKAGESQESMEVDPEPESAENASTIKDKNVTKDPSEPQKDSSELPSTSAEDAVIPAETVESEVPKKPEVEAGDSKKQDVISEPPVEQEVDSETPKEQGIEAEPEQESVNDDPPKEQEIQEDTNQTKESGEEAKASSQPEEGDKSAQPEETDKSSQLEDADKPAQPEEAEKCSQPEEAEKSSQPEEAEKSSQPEEAEKSSQPEEAEKSSQPDEAGKSSQPAEAEKSSQHEEAKSAQPEEADKSSQREQTSNPIDSTIIEDKQEKSSQEPDQTSSTLESTIIEDKSVEKSGQEPDQLQDVEMRDTQDVNESIQESSRKEKAPGMDIETIDIQQEGDNRGDTTEEAKPSEEENPLEKSVEEESSQKEDTQFVGVNMDKEDAEKEVNNKDDVIEEDPIGAESLIPESQEGADEELCIIPDTERVLSQEEKDAAISMSPLRDLSEANVAAKAATTANNAEVTDESGKYEITKCNTEELQTCLQCVLKRKVKYAVKKGDQVQYVCHDACLDNFKGTNADNYVISFEGEIRVKDDLVCARDTPKLAFERKCVVCKKLTDDEENNLTWEIMDFCNEFCLSKYQKEIGSVCASCNQDVQPNSLGKYCVRFGNDIRQFCSSHCLEEYKKGLKVCSYCQEDMSTETAEGFLAPVGDKGQFKDFCSQKCMQNYDIMTNNRPPKVKEGTKCSVCKSDNLITIEYDCDGAAHYFCSDRCLVAFSFVNNIQPSKCSMCKRYFPNEVLEKNTMFYDNVQYSFCSNSCQNIYIIAHRKIVPCVWCKVKKYNFDMIRRYFKNGPVLNMCSIHCLSLFRVSVNAVHSKKTICNFCNKKNQPMYHLTMSDATIRNFCSYSCVMSFQNKYKKPVTMGNSKDPVPAGEPKKHKKFSGSDSISKAGSPPLPIISNVTSLARNGTFTPNQQNPSATTSTPSTARVTRGSLKSAQTQSTPNAAVPDPQTQIRHHVIIKPSPAPKIRNVSTMCKTKQHHKSTTMRPIMFDKGVQTEAETAKNVIPVPVPIFIPSPLPMYSAPSPYPVPFPIPIPVPIFIPTTRNSAKGIMKEIKKIQVKIPTDPYEAELLMMAEMVAGDKKEENTDSESDVDEGPPADDAAFSPEPVDASNTFGDDMLQMALKMASELEEPAVDLEGALTANTITAASQSAEVPPQTEEAVDDPQPIIQITPERQTSYRGRKRGSRGGKGGGAGKKRRMSQQPVDLPIAPQSVAVQEPPEKPDAHLCLKYTFGVNAWKQWVTTKNTELEKQSKYTKPFKTEILQLTADELNFSLCLFVKEVRKPNGAEYAPDTIYYLCLGIQQYLFENNRIDNIFCDPYYEQFTDSLDEVARKFSVLYNDSHYIVTRVEEEHLWESKQLGAHSPHVLLSTLMFFNTKHFNLTTVDEHMQLSFSHIMKHWKRNPNQAGVARVPGSRNVLLRFYPPQTAIQNNSRKKKVYEQQENEENPLRCPVKLYEFYLSKCPESVKTRNDVFYLQPERSCVPDSPVWYSTTALPKEALEKMLHRVKMVKEINVALLTS